MKHSTERDRALVSLLERCASRDRTALRELFDAESRRMHGIARRVLYRSELAEEAVQEAFIQVWQNAHRYDSAMGSPRAWLYTIVRFRAIDMLRGHPQEDALPPEELDRIREEGVDMAYASLDPDGRLMTCLQALDDWTRRSLLLAYVAGLTQAEIAGRAQRPLGTVKSWMRRGLRSLRECLG